jgi:hypothetical protein
MSSLALRSSLKLSDSDKQHFIERIESALSAGRISQQQATDMKSIFSNEKEGVSVDVKWNDVVSILLDNQLWNVWIHNKNTLFLKDLVLPQLKSEYKSTKRSVRFIKSIWRLVYKTCQRQMIESNYFGENEEDSDDSFAEYSDWEA